MAEDKSAPDESRPSTLSQDIYEIDLLFDFISGRSDKHMSALDKKMAGQEEKDATKTPARSIMKDFFAYRKDIIDDEKPPSAEQSAFIVELKDVLNTLVYPARGLTIAFTIMFSVRYHAFPPMRSSRLIIAQKAFPGYIDVACNFRFIKAWMSWTCLGVTLLGAILLWQAFYGEQLVSRFEDCKAKVTEAAKGIYAAVVPTAGTNGACYDLSVLCGSTQATGSCSTPASRSGQLLSLCADYNDKRAQLCAIVSDVGAYSKAPTYGVARFLLPAHDFGTSWCAKPNEAPTTGTPEDAPTLLAILTVVSNYLLPMLFGFSGSIAAFLRGLQDKVRDSVLAPRDQALMFIRLPLGIIAGIAVGLFYNQATSATFGTFTLTAPGVAFLAGYGAEAFFLSLDRLIDKVFSVGRDSPRGKDNDTPAGKTTT